MATRTVLLRHELPNGSWHFDWLVERPGEPEGRLLTFRVQVRLDGPASQGFCAVRLEDHRAAYLTYQGPIQGERGSVVRVAEGTCLGLTESPSHVFISVDFGFGERSFCGKATTRDLNSDWMFEPAQKEQ